MKKFLSLFFLAFITHSTFSFQKSEVPIDENKSYENGAVVSAHPIATKIGVDILKKGGNAIDAAIAVKFAFSCSLS